MAKKKHTRKDGLMEKKFDGKHFYGRSEKDIQDKILEYRTKKENGLLMDEVIDSYEDYITGDKSPLRYGTVHNYTAHLARLREYFSGKPINDIEPTDIQSFLFHMKVQNYSAKTISCARGVASCVFVYWCSQMHGDSNPVALTRLPSGIEKHTRMPPTIEQQQIVQAHPEGDGFWVQLFMYTGCRLGEANGLTWDDVDLEENHITIDKAYPWKGNQPYLEQTKTVNAVRQVPILAPFLPVLKRQAQLHNKTDYLLSGDSKPLTQSRYNYRWMLYCKSINLVKTETKLEKVPATKSRPARTVQRNVYKPVITAHQFRHLYATFLFEAGIPDLAAQKLLGHADIMTTKKIYQHFREQTMPAYAEKLNAYFAKKMT